MAEQRSSQLSCDNTKEPTAIVVIGMAGSGKTTFMQRINSYLHSKKSPPYLINLDPAVHSVPFDCNIDIRDSLDYKEVMREYNLGPNGGILTSLNIFATKIDQIINILEARATANVEDVKANPIQNIIVDTPGQIEVFVWSASGAILLDSLASTFPTVIAYVIDTPRTSSPGTFMSNMLYACSILYKTKLPMILVFNKTDVKDSSFAEEWMTDFEAFQAALRSEDNESSPGHGGSGYMNSLLNSMSLMLEEFYRHLSVVGVSSMTGQGVPEFFAAVQEKSEEFKRVYRPELEKRRRETKARNQHSKDNELGKMMKDMNVSDGGATPADQNQTLSDLDDISSSDSDGNQSDTTRQEIDERNLSERYRSALSLDDGAGDMTADHSFARYLKSSQGN